MKCIYCNHELIWQSDFDTEDFGIDREGIVAIYICPECESEHQITRWID